MLLLPLWGLVVEPPLLTLPIVITLQVVLVPIMAVVLVVCH